MDVYARADFIVDETDGKFYCLEMNGLPGMTPASLIPKSARAIGVDYGDLCELIDRPGILRYVVWICGAWGSHLCECGF